MMTRTFKSLGVYSLICLTNNERPNILCIEGYCNGTANTQYFLHLYASATVPANASVPLRSFQLLGGDGFTFTKNDIGFFLSNASSTFAGNFTVVLSTTDATTTIATGAVTADINVDIEEFEIELAGTTTVGDTTTGAQKRTIAADPQSPSVNLVSLIVNNTSGGTVYLQLHCLPPTTGLVPVEVWSCADTTGALGNTGSNYLKFGSVGSRFQSNDSTGLHTGLYLAFSSTAATYTAAAGTSYTIQAIYK